ncbi:Aste57867_23939 [Aphanomyces stellatus]|uniref:Aste57867_23939 protein n=1 Tax=Aphanomyces stellatus TaxID=120398 RepID=A0A485LTG2_9STRA|nr:hypothetical protein As57867_023866 [Aphanomyces stellatus]VFU00582.1 Aste57867_23939 [Aphanomyces stellatus]
MVQARQVERFRVLQAHHSFSTWDHKRENTQRPTKGPLIRATPSPLKARMPFLAPLNDDENVNLQEEMSAHLDRSYLHADVVPLMEEDSHPFPDVDPDLQRDVSKDALRLGFPYQQNDHVEDPGDVIRQETRHVATVKAERVLSFFRRSLNERESNNIFRKVSLYSSNLKPNKGSVNKFFTSLETILAKDHSSLYWYTRAYLCGKDSEQGEMDRMSLMHPSHPLYDDLCGVILVHCRRAVATTYIRHTQRYATLPTVKRQLKAILEAKKWTDMEMYCGLGNMAKTPRMPFADDDEDDDNDGDDGDDGDDESDDEMDREWMEANLETDLVDFHKELDMAKATIAAMREAGSLDHLEMEKLLSIMVAFVKNAKVNRHILRGILADIPHATPTHSDAQIDAWTSCLVPFLSSDLATLDSIKAFPTYMDDRLQYKQRHDGLLRVLLEARMRTSHIYIRGLDHEVLDRSLEQKSDETRRDLLTTALNFATILDDRSFHTFYRRFVRHKLAWRSNFDDSETIFLDDVKRALPKLPTEVTDTLIQSLRRMHRDLTLEALSVCRLRVLKRDRLVRTTAMLSGDDDALLTVDAWHPQRTVFYSNLSNDTTAETVLHSFQKIGAIRNLWLFKEPKNRGVPVEAPADMTKKEEKRGRKKKVDDDAADDDDDDTDHADDDDDDEGKKGPKQHFVVASDRRSDFDCVIEFESDEAIAKALHPALKIFGVMLGETEKRPVFASPPAGRSTLCIHSIPFCTQIKDVHAHLQAALGPDLTITLGDNALPDLFVTKGVIEIELPSYEHAATVVDRLRAYLDAMPDPKVYPRVAKKKESASTRTYKHGTTKKRHYVKKQKEDEEEFNRVPTVHLVYEEGVKSEAYRPFEVSWTRMPRRFNK